MRSKIFNTILIVLCIVVTATILLYGYSSGHRPTTIFLFPVFIAIIVYLGILTVFGEKINDARKTNYAFIILLIGFALFGTGWGYHLASDEIHETFSYIKKSNVPNVPENYLEKRLYSMDEEVSHWLLASGFAVFGLGIIFVGLYMKRINDYSEKQGHTKITISKSVASMFIPKFAGGFTGTLAGLFAIAGGVIYSVAGVIILTIIVLLITYGKRKMTNDLDRTIFVFGLVFLSSIVAVATAYLLTSAFFDIRFR